MSIEKVKVKVAYALREEAVIIELSVPIKTSIEETIKLSGILDRFPEIDLSKQKVGVYGKLSNLATSVQDGDRIEIYRQLLVDPKDIRRLRAKKNLLPSRSKPTSSTT
ncbi:RnfH family protein [Candidatus Ichthyocystis hellenicum]|uniref:RnfH family protein n=1 Tax=Candidatus Ichthyocystis hellenicum TaxID=1561003 RepID=UPI000B82094F|nr:RnfH family protein [Candidatus Ichthyocystis hellenicum]